MLSQSYILLIIFVNHVICHVPNFTIEPTQVKIEAMPLKEMTLGMQIASIRSVFSTTQK